jgi:RNA polymerase sigma-70 factor (ECF subfamily)
VIEQVRNESSQTSDEELLRQMMAGNAAAFEMLYERRHPGVYRFALRMSGSAAFAEDITQDVFMMLMRDGHQFDAARGTVSGYLYGMARHRVLRRLERERSFISVDDETAENDQSLAGRFTSDEDPLDDLSRQQMIGAVRQAVLALPPHYREVVVFCHLHEMSYEEAAEIIGCPVGTVRSRLSRARAMLLEKLRALRNHDEPSGATMIARYEL